MNYRMRPSRVLQKMREGKVATCTKMNTCDQRVIEIAALCGFDCIWLDMEHVPNGIEYVENAVRTAKAYNTDILTRISRGSYSDYVRPFEADSTGIMVPHLMSLEDAKHVQYYTKFHPIGRRPIDGGNADGAYELISGKEYMEQANRERFVVVQIEDPEPMKELEEICQLPGIDMIFFGPTDYSQGCGIPFEFGSSIVDEARRLVAKTARKYGKFAGTVGDPEDIPRLAEMGYTFVSFGADVNGLTDYFTDMHNRGGEHEIVAFEDIK